MTNRRKWLWGLVFSIISASLTPIAFAGSTQLVGGLGGKYFSRQCPPGQFLVGINGATGSYVDSITPSCAPVSGTRWQNENFVEEIGARGHVPTPAPTATGEQLNCANDRLIASLTVATNTTGFYIASIQSHCRRINNTGSELNGPSLPRENPAQNGHRLACPQGQFGKGFSGRSGDFIDAIRLDCATLSGTYSEDTVLEAGGAGGAPAVSNCPSNQRMIGLISRVERGLAGTWIKGLRPVCATMPNWRQEMIPALMSSGRVGDVMRLARNVGADSGDSNRLLCPVGQYVESVETFFERFLHGVKLRCRTMTYSREGSSRFSGRSEGKREYLSCPGDMVASGIVTRAGSAVDALRLRCKRDANPATRLLAIIGDSFSAGEGAPDIIVSSPPNAGAEGPGDRTQRAGWADRPCHRSNKAGTTLAAKQMVRETGGQVAFRNFSCSGATVNSGLVGAQETTSENSAPIDPQIRSAGNWAHSYNKRLHTLLVSVGGNDAGFGARIGDCTEAELYEDMSLGYLPRACAREESYRDNIRSGLGELPGVYRDLQDAISTTLRPNRVFLRSYPDPVSRESGYCGFVRDLGERPGGLLLDGIAERALYDTLGEFTPDTSATVYRSFIAPLITAMQTAADTHGWQLISGWDQITRQGHAYCEPASRRHFNLPSDTHRDQGNFRGVFHPNARGYIAEAPLITQAVLPGMRDIVLPRRTVSLPTRPTTTTRLATPKAAPSKPAANKPQPRPSRALSNKTLQQSVQNYLAAQDKRARIKRRAMWDARAKSSYRKVRTGYLVETDVLVNKQRIRMRFTCDSRGRVTQSSNVSTKKK